MLSNVSLNLSAVKHHVTNDVSGVVNFSFLLSSRLYERILSKASSIFFDDILKITAYTLYHGERASSTMPLKTVTKTCFSKLTKELLVRTPIF